MWEYEHSVRTSAAPDAVWRRWTDMASWPEWNDGIETITVDGPFATGTTFTMTSQVLARLEAKGLLERTTDPADTRAKRLRVTAAGAALASGRSAWSTRSTRSTTSSSARPAIAAP